MEWLQQETMEHKMQIAKCYIPTPVRLQTRQGTNKGST